MNLPFKEFKEFALKGNVIDLAVGIVIGAAFTKVVNSLVSNILMPPLGLLTRSTDFVKQWGIQLPVPGVGETLTIRVGSFLDNVLQFVIVAFAIFLLVRAVNRLRAPVAEVKAEPTTRECPYCTSSISAKAKRCPFCTSQL